MKRNYTQDNLIEIKHPRNGAVWGVRNGGYTAYIWEKQPKGSWEHRFTGGIFDAKGNPVGRNIGTNDLTDAKRIARQAVSGRAFRSFMRRFK